MTTLRRFCLFAGIFFISVSGANAIINDTLLPYSKYMYGGTIEGKYPPTASDGNGIMVFPVGYPSDYVRFVWNNLAWSDANGTQQGNLISSIQANPVQVSGETVWYNAYVNNSKNIKAIYINQPNQIKYELELKNVSAPVNSAWRIKEYLTIDDVPASAIIELDDGSAWDKTNNKQSNFFWIKFVDGQKLKIPQPYVYDGSNPSNKAYGYYIMSKAGGKLRGSVISPSYSSWSSYSNPILDPAISGGAVGYNNLTCSNMNNGSYCNFSTPITAINISGTLTNFNTGFSESWNDNTTNWDNDAVNTITDSVVSGWLRVTDATTSTYFKELSATGAQNRIKDSIFNASQLIGTGDYNISFNIRMNNSSPLNVGSAGIALLYSNGSIETWAGLDDSSSGDTVIKNATIFPSTQYMNRLSTVSNLQNNFFNINRTNGIVTVYVNGVNISSGASSNNIRYVAVVVGKYSVQDFVNYIEIQNLTIGSGNTQYTFWFSEKTNSSTPILNTSSATTTVYLTSFANPVQNFQCFNNISYNGFTCSISVQYSGDTQSQSITAANGYYWQNTTYQPGENATNVHMPFPLNSATFTDAKYKGLLTITSNIPANVTGSGYNSTYVWVNYSSIPANFNVTTNFSIPLNNNATASVSNQTFELGSSMIVTCTANDPDSNVLNISMTVNGTLKQSSSCSFDYTGLATGNYSSTLNVTDFNGTIGTQPYNYSNFSFYVNVSADITPPAAPTISNGTVGTTTILLSSTNSSDYVYYNWSYKGNLSSNWTYPGNTTINTTTLSGLVPGQTYDVKLFVVDASGNPSVYSNVITIQTLTSDPTTALLLANDVLIINEIRDMRRVYEVNQYMEGLFLLLAAIILVLPKVKNNFIVPVVGIAISGWLVFNGVDHTNPQAYILTGGYILLGVAFGISAFYSIMRGK